MERSDTPSEVQKNEQDLINQLQDYSRKIRNLRTGDAFFNSSQYLKVASDMEGELNNLRSLYHRELLSLREEIISIKADVDKDFLKESHLSCLSNNLQHRIGSLQTGNQHLLNRLHQTEAAVKKKSQRLDKLDHEVSKQEEAKCNPAVLEKLETALAENEVLMERVHQQELERKELERKANLLEHKLTFDQSATIQHTKELENQLSRASGEILKLEAHIRQLCRPEHAQVVDSRIKDVKQEASHKLHDYQRDTEAKLSQQLTLLHCKADTNHSSFSRAFEEKKRLVSIVEELNSNIRNLQSEFMQLDHQRKSLEENLEMERDSSNQRIEALESQFSDNQEILFDKMKELTKINLQNFPVKAEVEALKSLITEEGKRLGLKAIRYDGIPYLPSDNHNNSAPPETKSAYDHNNPRAPSSDNRWNGTHQPLGGHNNKPDTEVKNIIKENIGQGRQYFDVMFKERAKHMCGPRPKSVPVKAKEQRDQQQPYSSTLWAVEVYYASPDGRYITLHNSSNQDVEIEGYSLKQIVCGKPVCSFIFPRVDFRAGSFITVFSATCSPDLHQPPSQFIFRDQMRWGTGPECTTVLCNPDGKAVAWVNSPYKDSVMVKEEDKSKYVVRDVESVKWNDPELPVGKCSKGKITPGLLRGSDGNTGGALMRAHSASHHKPPFSRLCDKQRSHTPHSASAFRMGSSPIRKFVPTSL